MNKVQLVGRLTKAIEIKEFANKDGAVENKMGRFTLAIPDGVKENGEQITQFITCVSWGRLAEIIAQYTDKGRQLAVCGKLKNNNYEKDGVMHYQTEVYVEGIDLLGTRSEEKPEEKPKYSGSKYTRRSR